MTHPTMFPADTQYDWQSEMEPLLEKAEREGLWFFHSSMSGALWFSPAELRVRQAKGQYRWGPANWQLRDPMEYVEELRAERLRLNQHAQAVADRIQRVLEQISEDAPDGRRQ